MYMLEATKRLVDAGYIGPIFKTRFEMKNDQPCNFHYCEAIKSGTGEVVRSAEFTGQHALAALRSAENLVLKIESALRAGRK